MFDVPRHEIGVVSAIFIDLVHFLTAKTRIFGFRSKIHL
jgi:hypothetical protein